MVRHEVMRGLQRWCGGLVKIVSLSVLLPCLPFPNPTVKTQLEVHIEGTPRIRVYTLPVTSSVGANLAANEPIRRGKPMRTASLFMYDGAPSRQPRSVRHLVGHIERSNYLAHHLVHQARLVQAFMTGILAINAKNLH